MLKKLMIGAAFAAMIASPALAQSYNPAYGRGNSVNQPAAELSDGAVGHGANAFDYYPYGEPAPAYQPYADYQSPHFFPFSGRRF